MNLSNVEHVPSLELGTLLHVLAFLLVAEPQGTGLNGANVRGLANE
jgi:hypothetical protein